MRRGFLLIMSIFLFGLTFNAQNVYAETTCNHEWSEWIVEEEATCSDTGSKYRYCIKCDAEEEGIILETSHTWVRLEKIKPTPYYNGAIIYECRYCPAEHSKSIPKRKMTSAEKKSINTLKKFFKQAKKYNAVGIKTCVYKGKEYIFNSKKYMQYICKKYNKKYLSYKIIDVDTKNQKIYVDAKVTYPDAKKALKKAMRSTYKQYYAYMGRTSKKYWNSYDYAGVLQKNIKKYVKKYGVKKRKTDVTFILFKTSGKYKIKNFASDLELADVINCGYEKAYEEFMEELDDYTEELEMRYL